MTVQADEKDTEGLYKELAKQLRKTKPNIAAVYQTQQLTFKSSRKEVHNHQDNEAVLTKFPFLKVVESVRRRTILVTVKILSVCHLLLSNSYDPRQTNYLFQTVKFI